MNNKVTTRHHRGTPRIFNNSFLHRATHLKKSPKRFKKLWRHHNLHHYKYPDKAFSVSNTFWDWAFGTMPPKKD